MNALSTSTSRAQPTALASMGGVDEARSSAAGGEPEMAYSLSLQLILAAGMTVKVACFTCVVDRKGVWESTWRLYDRD